MRSVTGAKPLQVQGSFGTEIEQAKAERTRHLISEGLATRRNGQVIMARNLLSTLRSREMAETCDAIAARTGLPHRPTAEGDAISGTYRERLQLASGRFAMIDNGLGFELVPWRPALDRHLGQNITGKM